MGVSVLRATKSPKGHWAFPVVPAFGMSVGVRSNTSTPLENMAGDFSFTLKIPSESSALSWSYAAPFVPLRTLGSEGLTQNPRSCVFAPVYTASDEATPQGPSSSTVIIYAIVAAAILLLILTVLVVRRRKQRAAPKPHDIESTSATGIRDSMPGNNTLQEATFMDMAMTEGDAPPASPGTNAKWEDVLQTKRLKENPLLDDELEAQLSGLDSRRPDAFGGSMNSKKLMASFLSIKAVTNAPRDAPASTQSYGKTAPWKTASNEEIAKAIEQLSASLQPEFHPDDDEVQYTERRLARDRGGLSGTVNESQFDVRYIGDFEIGHGDGTKPGRNVSLSV